MKAVRMRGRRSVGGLRVMQVQMPVPKDNEVLVRICASSINDADLEQVNGTWMTRLAGNGRNKMFGSDLAGVVETVGKDVSDFLAGDEVLADIYDLGFGAFAQYVCVPASVLSRKPKGVTFEQAATIPQAALCALQGLKKKQIEAGDKVLINGAGGGMGSYAIQMAKNKGAIVTGVDRGDKNALMKALGADECIDYEETDFAAVGETYDFVLDMVAKRKAKVHKSTLKPGGVYVVVGGKLISILSTHLNGGMAGKDSKSMRLLMWKTNDKQDIKQVLGMIEDGVIVPTIDRVYPLDDIKEAFEYFEKGNAKGKVVITMR